MSENQTIQEVPESVVDPTLQPRQERLLSWGMFGIFMLVLIGAYWNMLVTAASLWQDDLYSHGYLIPLLSIVLLVLRQQPLRRVKNKERYIGLGIIVFATLIRIFLNSVETLDQWTFVIAFVGVLMFVGGKSMLRWAGPVAFLLIFMFPPDAVTPLILDPMQHFATTLSVVVLKIFGFAVIQDGNTITTSTTTIGIVEQCSGLRMTTIFLALSIALVLINERAWWENVVILVMAVPIALITNVTRIVVTGMIFTFFPENETIHKWVHDGAGICMVPIAIGLLIGLQAILSHIFVLREESEESGLIDDAEEVFWKDGKKIED